MPADEHDFRKALASHIRLLEIELAHIASTIEATPVGERDELELIHERLSNLIGVMKEDFARLS
jgi:hypothetical protein